MPRTAAVRGARAAAIEEAVADCGDGRSIAGRTAPRWRTQRADGAGRGEQAPRRRPRPRRRPAPRISTIPPAPVLGPSGSVPRNANRDDHGGGVEHRRVHADGLEEQPVAGDLEADSQRDQGDDLRARTRLAHHGQSRPPATQAVARHRAHADERAEHRRERDDRDPPRQAQRGDEGEGETARRGCPRRSGSAPRWSRARGSWALGGRVAPQRRDPAWRTRAGR